jgi:hypothetical protein
LCPCPPARQTRLRFRRLRIRRASALPYAEVLSVLEVTPWAGRSLHEANPDGAVRRWIFGPDAAGQVLQNG